MKRKIKYRCCHISCRNSVCYEGDFSISKDRLDALKEVETGVTEMRAPVGICKIGTPQVFEILEEKNGEPETKEEKTKHYKDRIIELNKVRKRLLKEKQELDIKIKQAEKNLRSLNSALQSLKAEEK